MKIIGLAGQMRSGKDVTSDYLIKSLSKNGEVWMKTAFAKDLKEIYMNTFGVDSSFIEKWKTCSYPPPGHLMTVRQALQFIGDGFRNIKTSVWIDLTFSNIKDNTIISDVRYINELLKIKQEGGINILVWRPGKENDDPNASESQMRGLVDYFAKYRTEGRVNINNKTIILGENLIDFFLINDKDLLSLRKKIEDLVVPDIKNILGV